MITSLFGRKRRPAEETTRLTGPDTAAATAGLQGVVALSDGATSQLSEEDYTVPPDLQGATGVVHPLELVSAQAREDEAEALQRVARVHGPQERKALILALILTPRSHREKTAWREETAPLAGAEDLRADARSLTRLTRLPVLERLLRETATAPIEERRELLAAARRVMSADGHVRALDRLHWLAMRHLLGDGAAKGTMTPAGVRESDLANLSDPVRREAAAYTAFLARMVPASDESVLVTAAGSAWHQRVVAQMWPGGDAPACQVPDTDRLVAALRAVQQMSWMLRPLLMRTWVSQAEALSVGATLGAEAAEALRLTCVLLDVPLPPALAACFTELASA